jgi:hypothetical protein
MMAELTHLESTLGEVTGLAMAAQAATEKVRRLALEQEPGLLRELEQMHTDAVETARRCSEIADRLESRAGVRETAEVARGKSGKMLATGLDDDASILAGFEFLTMAEAGEVEHWRALAEMARQAGRSAIVDLCAWALPIQEHHLCYVSRACEQLAGAGSSVATA